MSLKLFRRYSALGTGMVGLVGGMVAWTVGEPVMWYAERSLASTSVLGIAPAPDLVFAGTIGLYLGFFLGATEGVLSMDRRTLARGLAFGTIAGLIGGVIGGLVGNVAFDLMLKSAVGRWLGWAAFGALLGVAPGMALKAVDRAARGFLGGAVGGFLGGAIFQVVSKLFEFPVYGRMVSIPLLGAVLGACYGLAETLLRRAWLTVLSGAAEGYEFALSGRAVTIGAGARADLRLTSDPPLPGLALELAPKGPGFVLKKLDLDVVTVNNEKCEERPLADGDVIRVRGIRILFSHRDGKATMSATAQASAPAPGPRATQKVVPLANPGSRPANPASRPANPVSNPGSLVSMRYDPPEPPPSRAGMKRALEGVGGKVEGHRFPLDAETITIGRDDGNDIVLDDLSVSLRHAEIVRKGKNYVIFDLSSSNGTFVQGRRVTENALKNGFTLEIGQVKFRFVETPE